MRTCGQVADQSTIDAAAAKQFDQAFEFAIGKMRDTQRDPGKRPIGVLANLVPGLLQIFDAELYGFRHCIALTGRFQGCRLGGDTDRVKQGYAPR